MTNVVELLRLGRKRIKSGWAQGSWSDTIWSKELFFSNSKGVPHVSYCALGAIRKELTTQPDTIPKIVTVTEAYNDAVKFLYNAIPDDDGDKPDKAWVDKSGFIVFYNDAPDRTKADIVRLYDRAIQLAKDAK